MSPNTIMNVYISMLTLGLKYMKILEISGKFQGNFIKHNNECIHIHANPRSEIYENFRNFSESSEIITSSDTWGLGLYAYDYCSN